MNKQAKRLLWLAGLIFLGQCLSGLFVQAYMWEQGGGLTALVRFNLAIYVSWAVGFLMLGRAVKRGHAVAVFRLSLVLQVIFFLTVLALSGRAGQWLFPLGLLSGLGGGTFWIAQNMLSKQATTAQDQARFWGYEGAMFATASLVGPLGGSWLITLLGRQAGYTLLFALAAAAFAAAGIGSAGLVTRGSVADYDLPAGLQDDTADGRWSKILWAHIVGGLREGILSFLPAILVYAATGRELAMGNFVVLTSGASLLANWVAGRWGARQRQFPTMLISGVLQAGGALLLLARSDYGTLLLYTLVASVAGPLHNIPLQTFTFTTIGSSARDLSLERIVMREMALVAGRMAGMGLLLGLARVTDPQHTPVIALMVVAALAVVPALLVRRVIDSRPLLEG